VPALANIVGYYVIGMPLGVWLAHSQGMGPRGLWYGLVAGLATVAGLLLVRLRATIREGGYRVTA
jgi:MATE family multidrug resistance protein